MEIATAVRRHMDRESTQAPNGATLVPNLYKIRLSETDFQEAKKYGSALAEELCQEIIRHADSQSYTLLGSVRATFVKNTELKRGQMSIETTTDAGAAPEAPAAPKAAAQPTPAAGPEATAALPTSMAAAGAQAATTTAILEHAGNTYPWGGHHHRALILSGHHHHRHRGLPPASRDLRARRPLVRPRPWLHERVLGRRSEAEPLHRRRRALRPGHHRHGQRPPQIPSGVTRRSL
ncbi:DUF3662 domain-containing protein [Nesterenkonia pannonica]|uniref:DUF3662 domain-containing protein n=1 Tax=Nesterenkonia pannonica TaxID=1548602 RepID=UPI00216488E0|nr:DUF3662 domain-containing protein [Nesterenkonia pannonica]